jgi:hypothetical protein
MPATARHHTGAGYLPHATTPYPVGTHGERHRERERSPGGGDHHRPPWETTALGSRQVEEDRRATTGSRAGTTAGSRARAMVGSTSAAGGGLELLQARPQIRQGRKGASSRKGGSRRGENGGVSDLRRETRELGQRWDARSTSGGEGGQYRATSHGAPVEPIDRPRATCTWCRRGAPRCSSTSRSLPPPAPLLRYSRGEEGGNS